MQALILAGGKGTRLRPYTTVLPKPLLPVGDMPIIEILIRQLKYYGFTKISIAVGYLPELFKAVINSKFEDITFIHESTPLGTAGAIALLEAEDNFLVVNGDTLTDLDFSAFFKFHTDRGCLGTIAAHEREITAEYGVLEVLLTPVLNKYLEKPTWKHLASMGVYAFKREIQSGISGRVDIPDLINSQSGLFQCFQTDAFWLDVGRPSDYERAQEEFGKRRESLMHE